MQNTSRQVPCNNNNNKKLKLILVVMSQVQIAINEYQTKTQNVWGSKFVFAEHTHKEPTV